MSWDLVKMTDKDYYYNKISQAFMNIGKEVPDDDSIVCIKVVLSIATT